MSKHLGNVVSPFDELNKFGADALRLPLTSMEEQNRAVLFAEMRKLGIAV